MKYVRSHITASDDSEVTKPIGTIFYEATVDEIIKAMEDADVNPWIVYMIKEHGLSAIIVKDIFGSAVIEGKLYLCKTDGRDIRANGEFVDPEIALSQYSVSHLNEYIEPATPEIITQMITEYEVQFTDIDEIAVKMIEDGLTFSDIAMNAYDLDLISVE